ERALAAACEQLAGALSLDQVYVLVAHSDPGSSEGAVLGEFPALHQPGEVLPLEGFETYRRLETQREPVIVEPAESGEQVPGLPPHLQSRQLHTLMLIPLLVQDDWIGFMMMGSAQAGGSFSEADRAAVQMVAAQVAASLRSADLMDEIQRRASQLDQVTAFGRLITSTLDRSRLLQHVAELIPGLLPTEQLQIALLAAGQSRMRVITLSKDAPPQEDDTAAAGSSIEEVVRTQNPMLVLDLQSSAYTDHRHTIGQGMRSVLVAPLSISGRAMGVVMVSHSRPHRYTPTDLTLLQQIAHQIAIALENARQYQVAQQRALYEEALSEITSDLQQQADLRVMLQQTMADLGKVLGAHRARVRLQVTPPEAAQSARVKE
ncbi:MAG: GAF domain-containing protein, partial [Chloroflexi bacterium]